MSFFSDNFAFEKFQLGDWWKKIKDNPEQLLLGAGDPLGAKIWSGATGKKYEPFVDAMGGPYGGHALSVGGSTDGGVYGRAKDAGINTKPARNTHNVAHAIAAFYALGGGALGGAGAGGAGATGASGSGGAGGLLGGAGSGGYAASAGDLAAIQAAQTSAAGAPATGAWAGGASSMAPASGFNWGQGLQMANGLLGQSQQQPQQSSPPPQQQPRNESLQRQLAVARRLQELRAKPRKTPAERLEMQELMKNPMGLL